MPSLTFRLFGRDVDASSTLNKVGVAASFTGGKLNDIARRGATFAAVAQGAAAAYQTVAVLAPAAALVAPAALAGAQAMGVLKLASDQVKTSFSVLAPDLDRLKKTAGGAIAPGLTTLVASLRSDLPTVQAGVKATAGAFGGLAAQAGAAFSGPAFRADLGSIMGNNATLIGRVGSAALTMGRAFVGVAATASPVLTGLSGGLGGLADKTLAWVNGARQSGQLSQMIATAVTGLRQLVGTVRDVAVGVGSILGTIAGTGGSVLGVVADMAEQFRGLATSAPFLASIRTLFTAIHDAVGPVIPVLAQVVMALAGALAPAIAALLPFVSQIAVMIGDQLVVVLHQLAPTLLQLAPHVGQLAQAFGRIVVAALPLVGLAAQLLVALAPLIVDIANWAADLAECRPAIIAIGAVIGSVLIGQLVAAGIAATVSAATQLAAWASTAAGALASAASAAVGFAVTIGGWLASAATAVASAALMAAAWLISIAPIALVIAAVAGLAFLIYHYWGDITAATAAAWHAVAGFVTGVVSSVVDFVKSHWPLLLAILTGPIGIAAWTINRYWSQISGGVATAFNTVVGFFRGLPARIVGTLGGLGSLLYNAGSALIGGLLRGITDKFHAVTHFVGGIAHTISNLKGPLPYDRTLLVPHGQALMAGLDQGIDTGFGAVRRRVSGIAPAISAAAASSIGARTSFGAGGGGGGMVVNLTINGSVSTIRGQANELAPHVLSALHHIGVGNGGTVPGTNIRVA